MTSGFKRLFQQEIWQLLQFLGPKFLCQSRFFGLAKNSQKFGEMREF